MNIIKLDRLIDSPIYINTEYITSIEVTGVLKNPNGHVMNPNGTTRVTLSCGVFLWTTATPEDIFKLMKVVPK